jgi:hypothetical protein
MRRAISKYSEYADIKVFGHIHEFLWIKNLFSSQTGHVFFGDCIPPVGKCTLGTDDIMLLKNTSEPFKSYFNPMWT